MNQLLYLQCGVSVVCILLLFLLGIWQMVCFWERPCQIHCLRHMVLSCLTKLTRELWPQTFWWGCWRRSQGKELISRLSSWVLLLMLANSRSVLVFLKSVLCYAVLVWVLIHRSYAGTSLLVEHCSMDCNVIHSGCRTHWVRAQPRFNALTSLSFLATLRYT